MLKQTDEEDDEKFCVLQDARQLKVLADFFLHPEKPVRVNGTALGRCYPFAAEQEDLATTAERAQILKDVATLKRLAKDYYHPELPVETTSATACARCYYDRASAPQPNEEEEEDRDFILNDLQRLKQAAFDYLHPEAPIATEPTVFGRNYFMRASAIEPEAMEYAAERKRVLQEAQALKKLAVDYLHPEAPIHMNPTVFGRNYFTRPSAVEAIDEEERNRILADAKELKKLAVDYLHPEIPLTVTDPTLFGRNYFHRPSAQPTEDIITQEERNRVFADAQKLRRLATDYLHPEIPVIATDATVFGRNYFNRPSAVEQTMVEEDTEAAKIKQDLLLLKRLAVDYKHPEIPVVTSDPTACGRNYFDRASAVEPTTFEEDVERNRILVECRRLKQLAVDYHHPERPITTDPRVICRNYFSRPAAVGVSEHIHTVATPPEVVAAEWSEDDFYYNHHAFFDMDDDVHLHHVAFDNNVDHHHEITELRVAESGFQMDDSFNNKLSSSPECVMFAAHPRMQQA